MAGNWNDTDINLMPKMKLLVRCVLSQLGLLTPMWTSCLVNYVLSSLAYLTAHPEPFNVLYTEIIYNPTMWFHVEDVSLLNLVPLKVFSSCCLREYFFATVVLFIKDLNLHLNWSQAVLWVSIVMQIKLAWMLAGFSWSWFGPWKIPVAHASLRMVKISRQIWLFLVLMLYFSWGGFPGMKPSEGFVFVSPRAHNTKFCCEILLVIVGYI